MIQTGKGDGMQLLDQAIMDFLMKKQIAPEEAYLKANDKNAFERFIKKP
jgi:twitching motility protein PilT